MCKCYLKTHVFGEKLSANLSLEVLLLSMISSLLTRDKKAFLGDQCKDIEENNRMKKTKDLFKKTRDTMGTFHAKMGTIKDTEMVWT